MNKYRIIEFNQLNDIQKEKAVEIFIEGFGHMMTFSKDKKLLRSLFLSAMNPFFVLACLEEKDVLGILGFATNKIRPIKLEMTHCVELFGKFKGVMICRQMNAIFQSNVVNEDTDFYVDILATTEYARGKGVATRLLDYCFELPIYENYYIEVLSKNTNAQRLYEKYGFVVYKRSRFSTTSLMGFGYPIKMKKTKNASFFTKQ